MPNTNKMIGRFESKPKTQAMFRHIDDYIRSLGPVETEVKSQMSYKRRRKFVWMWSYEKTKDGTLFLAFLLDRKCDADCIHTSTQVSKNRWNHTIVLTSLADAKNKGLAAVLLDAYHFAGTQ